MKKICLIKFQTDCSTVLENVQQTNETVLITKQGKPLVKIIPTNRAYVPKFLGRLEGKIKIVGDIEAPLWLS